MSDAFDPYHRWLGIPLKDQPPHHYRLLGIDPFEEDAEVIRDAAERQMGHIRRYQLGPHSAISQKILNEIGAAKSCLLDRDKKVAYDAVLGSKLSTSNFYAEQSAQHSPPPPPPALPSPSLMQEQLLPALDAGGMSRITNPFGKKGSWRRVSNWSLYLGLGIAVILGVISVMVFILGGDRPHAIISDAGERIEKANTGTEKALANQDAHSAAPNISEPAQQMADKKSTDAPPADKSVSNPVDKSNEAEKSADKSVVITSQNVNDVIGELQIEKGHNGSIRLTKKKQQGQNDEEKITNESWTQSETTQPPPKKTSLSEKNNGKELSNSPKKTVDSEQPSLRLPQSQKNARPSTSSSDIRFQKVIDRMVAAYNEEDYRAIRLDFNNNMPKLYEMSVKRFRGLKANQGKIMGLGPLQKNNLNITFENADKKNTVTFYQVKFTANLEQGTADFIVGFDKQDKIVGLWVVPHKSAKSASEDH